MPLGAHISTAGGLSTCIGRAETMGAECMQIFLSSPQRWQHPSHTDEQVEEFGRLLGGSGIGPNFAHASYLINLAAADPGIRQRSIDNLSSSARWADRVGIAGIVVHVGSSRGQSIAEAEAQIAESLAEVLRGSTTSAILLENSAASGELLGSRFAQIGDLLARLGNDPRLGLCLDTAHSFASGYDLRIPAGLERAIDEISQHIGLERLRLIHANDSKVDLNSAVDRHANIGRGFIGEAAFQHMLAHPVLAPLPWVLEVPGYDDKGPDQPNLDALKRLAGRGAAGS